MAIHLSPTRRLLAAAVLLAGVSALALLGTTPAGERGAPTFGPRVTHAETKAAFGRLPLHFELNQGQAQPGVEFLARGSGYTFSLSAAEATLSLRPGDAAAKALPRGAAALTGAAPERGPSAVVRLQLVDAHTAVAGDGLDELEGKVHYFVGDDPARWHTDVPTFAKVRYQGVYPGVDLIYYGNQHELEYDFVVAPGADPSRIAMRVAGAEGLAVDAGGDLVLRLAEGELRQRKPVLYQEWGGGRREVAGAYALHEDGTVGFTVGAYDRTRPLVIDPTLVYSTFFGGSAVDRGEAIAVDAGGNAYITGTTTSIDLRMQNPFQPAHATDAGTTDVFVSKLNASGTTLLYSTYLGGNSEDQANAIAVDVNGNAYITGSTVSTNFPLANAGQATDPGGKDAFVTKLSSAGNTLVYSTYLGGEADDEGYGIRVDLAGNAYVAGFTQSADFPTLPGSFRTTPAGATDLFIAKFNPPGSSLLYSTYLGGSSHDLGFGMAIDGSGNVYVTGYTLSPNYPTTPGAVDTTCGTDGNCNGFGSDVILTKLNADGASLGYSTFLGGNSFDVGTAVAVNSAGEAHVAGYTFSPNFPTTAGAIDQTCGSNNTCGAGSDGFVARVNASGSALVYSTFLGGSGNDFVNGIVVEPNGSAVAVGGSNSADFPIVDALQTALGGGQDAFVARLNATGSALLYSTFLGGSGADQGNGVAVDALANTYVTGFTESPNFPTTVGALDRFCGTDTGCNGGAADAFVARIHPAAPSPTPVPPTAVPPSVTPAASTTPTPTRTPTASATPTRTATPSATPTPTGPPCTTQVGGACEVTGGVTGTWVKTGSGAYRVTATGPANSAPGTTPQISIPTTNGLESGTCSAVGSSPPFTTTCAGSTVGDAVDNATVTVTFGAALAGRQAGQAAPTVTGQVGDPPSCQPRPNVTVAVSPGSSGRLDVTITASSTPSGAANLVWAVRVGAATNATVQSSGQQGSSNFTITPAPGSQEVRLTVIRTTAGQASTVPIVVADACGEWQTLVGGGPTAF